MAETLGRFRKLYATGVIAGRRINSVSLEAEAWLWRLMLIADDFGNMHAEPDVLAGLAAPRRKLRASLAKRLTDELEHAGLLFRYLADDGEVYIHLEGFEKFQKPSNGRRLQRFPLHPGIRGNPVESGESGCGLLSNVNQEEEE